MRNDFDVRVKGICPQFYLVGSLPVDFKFLESRELCDCVFASIPTVSKKE